MSLLQQNHQPTQVQSVPLAAEYINEKQIRQWFLPIGRRTLARKISSREFPAPDFRMGAKIRLWKVSTVRAHMEGSK